MKEFYHSITFANPSWLWGMLALPLLLAYAYFFNMKRQAALTISNLRPLQSIPVSYKVWIKYSLPLIRIACLAFLLMALARPQTSFSNEKITSEGIDIIIAMDVSYSMMAEDFRPNRLSASKNDALQFIKSRPDDRIGLVMFAGESFTLCPATSDHTVLINELKDLGNEDGKLADGTAIGMGLATAVDRLRESQAKSKVVILLTDGVNNQGAIQPLDAADIAKKYGIRVYTIGVGTEGQALIPIPGGQKTLMDVEIDEALLKKIAKQTGGKYFRAKNDTELKGIYKEIDHLEKTKVEINAFHHKGEKFYIFAMISGLLLLLEMVLRYAVVRAIP